MKKPCGSNRRIHYRYRSGAECSLTISGKTVKAVITDFSLSGMGVFIKGLHNIETPLITVQSSSLDLESQAKVVWAEKLFSGVRCGIHRIGHTTGTLRHFRFPDILMGLKKSGRTGVLHISWRDAVRKIFFRQGDMIFASSNLDRERMGDMLLDIGKISRSQFDESVDMMRKTGKRQGTALVELGYLSPTELVWAVQFQVEKIIHNLFGLREGNFVFHDEPLPLNEVITLQLSTGNLIYRGSKLVEDSELIMKSFPPADSVLCTATDESAAELLGSLDENDRKILSLINAGVTVQDILSLSPLPEKETLKSLFALFSARVVDIDEKAVAPEVGQAQEHAEEIMQEDDPALAEKIEQLYRKQKHLDRYGVLEVRWDSSPEEIKKAYHALVRQYHPDRHATLRSEELRHKLNVIFANINEAYRAIKQAREGRVAAAPQHPQEPEKVNNRELAKIRFREGMISFKARDSEQAMTLFGQAVYLDGSVPEYHYYYGKALLSKKKIKDAEESIKKAVQLSPENADFIAELGHIYLELGFKTRAKNTFEKALRFNPHHEMASAGLSQITS